MIFFVFAFLLALVPGADGYSATVREIDKKIVGHKRDLENLETQIRNLETEKARLKKPAIF